ncbi:UEV-domain-containing protein [Testicularia cyperi]|uniref:UEV-domain-containing protein n=1 Tax=Testicularia cyperi TaxID=1882483 RepID=A0A317XNA9_9BASI|nr:UEV-domain-containing protein [Testicularia cyperi]
MDHAVVQRWLRSVTAPYLDPDRVYADVDRALIAVSSLSPKTEVFTFNDGRTQLLLTVNGTIPIQFRNSTYNIPVAYWIPREYPRAPPMAFVVPTPEMAIRKGPNVDPSGEIGGDYLARWSAKPEACNLLDLIHQCQHMFGREPPVYARPKHQSPQPQQSLQPQSSQQPGYQQSPSQQSHQYQQQQQQQQRGPPPPPPPAPSPQQQQQQQQVHQTPPAVPPMPSQYSQRRDSWQSPASPHPYDQRPPAVPPVPSTHSQSIESWHSTASPTQQYHRGPPAVPHVPSQHPQSVDSWRPSPSPSSQFQSIPPAASPVPGPQPSDAWRPAGPPVPKPETKRQSLPAAAVGFSLLDEDNDASGMLQDGYERGGASRPDLNGAAPSGSAVAPPPRPPNPELLAMHDRLFAKIDARLSTLSSTLEGSNQQLQVLASDLDRGAPAIEDEMSRLRAVRDVCRSTGDRLEETVTQTRERIAFLKGKEEPDPDSMVLATSIVGNQLVELVAEDNAIEDTLYQLGRALNAERIDLDRFLKQTRMLAREQFMKRALAHKISEGMGWS